MRLTPNQEAMLRRIVATNGGGASISDDRRTFLALHKKGLAHQKSGNAYAAVHTRAGLDWVRANPPVPREAVI